MEILRRLLCDKQPTTVSVIPHNNASYNQIIHIWKAYRTSRKMNKTFWSTDNKPSLADIEVRTAFQYHYENALNHAILYYNEGANEILLFAKINGRYLTSHLPQVSDFTDKTFIAFYN